MIYTVYRATNSINGKQYIGIDPDWPSARISHETARADTYYFHRELRKYGPPLFSWEAVLLTDNFEEANALASELMAKSVVPNGYNLQDEYTRILDVQRANQSIRKLTEGLNGITASDFKVSEEAVIPEKTPRKGKITDEGRRKISEAVSRPVTIDGVPYRSITQACEKLDLPRHQVKMILKGKNTVEYYRKKNAIQSDGK
jgi:hypothetical protein